LTKYSVQLEQPGQRISSKIFWRITLGIFLSILLIEFVLLVYSWYGERSRLLTRLDESLVTVESLIDATNPIPQLEQLLSQNSPNLNVQVSANNPVLFNSNSGSYTRYFSIDASGSQNLILSIDASWINSYMQGYVKCVFWVWFY